MKLISAVTSQPETLCAYYLDLYYQVRSAYEREKAPPAAEPLTLEAVWPRLRELMEDTLRSAAEDQARAILDGMGLRPSPPPDYPAPARTMNTPETPETPFTAEAVPLPQTPQAAGGGEKAAKETMTEEERRAEIRRKRQENAAKAREALKNVGNSGGKNGMALATKEKRVIRERLLEARKNGLTNPQLLKESEGLFTEDDLWKIVEGHVVGIAIYREVNAALDRLEAKKSISA